MLTLALFYSPNLAYCEPVSAGSRQQLKSLRTELLRHDILLSSATWMLSAALVSPRDDAWTAWAVAEKPLGSGANRNGYWMGHRYSVGGSVIGLVGAGVLLRSAHVRDSGILLLEAHAISASIAQALKYAVQRDRPDHSNDRSFPSGHAAGAWTSALVLHGRFGAKIGIPALAAAGYIGFSRIQNNKHHPSDILFGFALGHWAARAVLRSADDQSQVQGWQWFPAPDLGDRGLTLLRKRY